MKLNDLLDLELSTNSLKALSQSKRLAMMNPELVVRASIKILKEIYPNLPEEYIQKVKEDYIRNMSF
ncbi:MAG: hypothetical protein KKA65_03965 [Nanoarchaeota archaeon]|nr:hypothetical protein [Nanoarchaeota archaeon]MBU4242228.1 hypothetical protein [Nanoarchaeota archaeon]MBU4351592.1 hypothetical protein [Nanoarchaeota archaeon]MBU4456633.1 hypothetical protein [Nanoarchaeota archaeon]MCG2719506.1 hypothetical protein [Nanoarchaeota archaeon]